VCTQSGCRSDGDKQNPFNELVYIILSSKTPPKRYQDTYLALRRVFPTSDLLAAAEPDEIVQAIAFGGLAHKKADQLSWIAKQLKANFGRVTLSPLSRMSDEAAEEFLTKLPGVGLKTARCVLMYSFDRPVFPVDSHCLRVARRLEWVENVATLTDRLANEIQEAIPRHLRKGLHIGMVLLGRQICLPTTPHCESCPILQYCPTGRR